MLQETQMLEGTSIQVTAMGQHDTSGVAKIKREIIRVQTKPEKIKNE